MKRSLVRAVGKQLVPGRLRRSLRERRLTAWPPVGHVRFGHLRRTTPIDSNFGYERGLPIDRFYIERFLAAHAGDIQGAALEFEDDSYLRRFGGDAVTSFDVLSVEADHPPTTIAADLAAADGLPTDQFDCIVCTQVLQLVYDVHAAVQNLRRMLRVGGVLLVTMPGITRVARAPNGAWEDQWRFTSASARRLFRDAFETDDLQIGWHGNPLVAISFLTGLAASDLKPQELEARDPDFEVVITVRAVRRA